MNIRNFMTGLLVRKKLGALVCLALLSIGCGSAKIDTAAQKEGETLANEASAVYKKSQQSISFDNKYSWDTAVNMDDEKTRNGKFTAAAKDLEAAKDKFSQASAKMKQAMNGQDKFASAETKTLAQKSQTYKMWSDLAEFERKTLQDASTMTDKKALIQKLTEAQAERDKMNKELMDYMKVTN